MQHRVIELKTYFPELGNNGCNPTLTLYLPYNSVEMNRQNQKRPNILLCPGGGYRFCSEREAEPIALHFLPEGYNVFMLNYSVAPNTFPTQLREVAAVMELIYQNADEWNADTSKIAIMGFSAGGHLAAHYSTSFDCPEVREVFPESKAVNASILCYPVITADPTCSHLGSFRNLTGKPEIDQSDVEKFSCELLVTEKTPPAFIWATATDASVPVISSFLYAQALSANKIPFELHIYPAGKHGLATSDDQTNGPLTPEVAHTHAWLEAMMKWLKITL